VLGHEISHVGNRDILIASVAAGLASMIIFLVDLAQLGALFGFGGSDEDSGPGLLEIVLISLLGPLAAGLQSCAIVRQLGIGRVFDVFGPAQSMTLVRVDHK
jgi:heat shock protein HtpX